jgi:hypothetical protein
MPADDTFIKAIEKHQDLPVETQKALGESVHAPMEQEHNEFLRTVLGMLDRKEIDILDPDSFLKREVYGTLPAEWKTKTDQALPNIVDQTRRIAEFYRSTATPNESIELQTMIEHLWQMKMRIEEKYDVFKF